MRRVFGVGVILLLVTIPGRLRAQVGGNGPPTTNNGGLSVGQNYPNPFNPQTKIPFVLKQELFERGRVIVTIRIYNVLHQLVAVPTALDHPLGAVPVEHLEYASPGRKEAFWDGNDRTGRQVPSGIYLAQVLVDGLKPVVIKMLVAK